MDSRSYSFYQFPHSLYKSSTPRFLFRLEGVSEVYLLATSIASGMHRKWVKKGMLSKVNLTLELSVVQESAEFKYCPLQLRCEVMHPL